jgi:hypothetical protein
VSPIANKDPPDAHNIFVPETGVPKIVPAEAPPYETIWMIELEVEFEVMKRPLEVRPVD